MENEVLVPGVELLESMRSVGYSFAAAVADLIDNAISAGAANIAVVGDPVAAEYVSILDDGAGMDAIVARSALRLAGSVGDGSRSKNDLGRFGLGLKTASLSQGRQLTVVTKKADQTTALEWDIDHVRSTGQWSLGILSEEEYKDLPTVDSLSSMPAGTVVIWRKLDYLLGNADDPAKIIAEQLAVLRIHLALTFHQFLDGPVGSRLRISVNGIDIQPIDPFLTKNPRTQISPLERISIDGKKVEVQAYTLPHSSGMSASERKRPDLGINMREAQGFYIYRNRRLISHGHWYGLARREELSKQSRVRVELPNSIDHLWQLDIKKSRAEPPQAFKNQLRRVMETVTGKSRRLHTFRGRTEKSQEIVHIWTKITDRDGYRYAVNNEHPSVKAVRTALDQKSVGAFESLLFDIGQGFPTNDLYLNASENRAPTQLNYSLEDVTCRLRDLRILKVFSGTPEEITSILRSVEPFRTVENLDTIIENVWKENVK